MQTAGDTETATVRVDQAVSARVIKAIEPFLAVEISAGELHIPVSSKDLPKLVREINSAGADFILKLGNPVREVYWGNCTHAIKHVLYHNDKPMIEVEQAAGLLADEIRSLVPPTPEQLRYVAYGDVSPKTAHAVDHLSYCYHSSSTSTNPWVIEIKHIVRRDMRRTHSAGFNLGLTDWAAGNKLYADEVASYLAKFPNRTWFAPEYIAKWYRLDYAEMRRSMSRYGIYNFEVTHTNVTRVISADDNGGFGLPNCGAVTKLIANVIGAGKND